MITFTLKHRAVPLRHLVRRLKQSFKLLRKEADWLSHVTGYAAFLECKWIQQAQAWHVHYHVLCEGTWWDQKDLSRLWHEVTGDSYIVDIRPVTDARGGAYYGAKYASKPFDAGSIADPKRLAEAVHELHSCRLWQVGGSWAKHLKLLEKGEDPGDWEFVCSLNDLSTRARAGEGSTLAVINAILNGEEDAIGICARDHPS